MRSVSTATVYGGIHFLIDLGCAFFMYRMVKMLPDFYEGYLIYNFLAFALQMPIGLLADRVQKNHRIALCGCVLTGMALVCAFLAENTGFSVQTALTEQVVLAEHALFADYAVFAWQKVWLITGLFLAGIGNCLFHVGGGIEVMKRSGRRAAPLGIFVAPGAIGVFLGTLLGKQGSPSPFYMVLFWAVAAGAAVIQKSGSGEETKEIKEDWIQEKAECPARNAKGEIRNGKAAEAYMPAVGSIRAVTAMSCFFLVVVLRSYLGMIAAFPWKTHMAASVICLGAVVGGKAAGGFLADRTGPERCVSVSLALATVLFGFSGRMIPGILALFCFNMSMPVTLYLAALIMREHPGFAFGSLTFAIFLGFLPAYAGYTFCSPRLLSLLSFLSLVLMAAGCILYQAWQREKTRTRRGSERI